MALFYNHSFMAQISLTQMVPLFCWYIVAPTLHTYSLETNYWQNYSSAIFQASVRALVVTVRPRQSVFVVGGPCCSRRDVLSQRDRRKVCGRFDGTETETRLKSPKHEGPSRATLLV